MLKGLVKTTLGIAPHSKIARRLLSEVVRRAPASRREVWAKLFTGQKACVDLAEYVGQDILVYGAFEKPACELVHRSLPTDGVFLDVGSHLGLYTLVAAHKMGPGGQVHAFEPGDKRRRLLELNVRENDLRGVTINSVAVGSHSGKATFMEGPARNLGTSRVVEGAGAGPSVTLVSLDQYCRERGVTRIDGMKIDVEGAEIEVLKGASETLRRTPPKFILFETEPSMAARYNSTPEQIHGILRGAGYTIHALVDGTLVPLERAPASATDFFATR